MSLTLTKVLFTAKNWTLMKTLQHHNYNGSATHTLNLFFNALSSLPSNVSINRSGSR